MILLQQIAADSAQRVLDKHYIDILEKTNNQLSAGWWTPFGVSIAFLTFFLTLGGIATAIILYRQSQDYQRRVEALLNEHRLAMTAKLTEADQRMADSIATFDASRAALDEKGTAIIQRLESVIAESEGAKKEKLVRIRDDFAEQREAARSEVDLLVAEIMTRKLDQRRIALAVPLADSRPGGLVTWRWVCPNCGKENYSNGSGLRGNTGLLSKLCKRCDETIHVAYASDGSPNRDIRPCGHCGRSFDRADALLGADWPDKKVRHKCPHCGNYSE